MNKQFSPETVEQVLGRASVPTTDGIGDKISVTYRRTPLHVDYGRGPGFKPSRPAETIDDETEFNAVGSQAMKGRSAAPELHLPVIDVDGGALVQVVRVGSKAVLYAFQVPKGEKQGGYGPSSLLRDVLGDNGIELEVFQRINSRYSSMMQRTYLEGQSVSSIVLRSREPGIFEAVESTQKDHDHLYIQQAFSAADHKALIAELGNAGIVGEEWQQLAERESMGIVRTPWTKHDNVQKRS